MMVVDLTLKRVASVRLAGLYPGYLGLSHLGPWLSYQVVSMPATEYSRLPSLDHRTPPRGPKPSLFAMRLMRPLRSDVRLVPVLVAPFLLIPRVARGPSLGVPITICSFVNGQVP